MVLLNTNSLFNLVKIVKKICIYRKSFIIISYFLKKTLVLYSVNLNNQSLYLKKKNFIFLITIIYNLWVITYLKILLS